MRIILSTIFSMSIFINVNAQSFDSLDFDTYLDTSQNEVLLVDSIVGNWVYNYGYLTIDSLDPINGSTYNTDVTSYLYFSIDATNSMLLGGGSAFGKLSIYHFHDFNSGDYGRIQFEKSGNWIDVGNSFGFDNWYIMYEEFTYCPNYFNLEYNYEYSTQEILETNIIVQCVSVFNPVENRGGSNKIKFRIIFYSDNIPNTEDGWIIDKIKFENLTGHCVGAVSEYQNLIQVEAFPTLGSGQISFESESENFSTITLYDFSGKQIENFNFSSTNFKTLQLESLSNGMYFYSVDDGKAKGKFIIEK